MPLVLGSLQGELINIYEKGISGNPSPQLVGIKTAKAYLSYVSAGINAGGGSFSGMPGSSSLGSELGNIYSSTSPSGAITGQKIARAFDTCLATFLSVYQTTIITAPGLGGLIGELINIFSAYNPSSTIFANKFARALNTYTSSAIVSGVIPGSPPVPFSGNIS